MKRICLIALLLASSLSACQAQLPTVPEPGPSSGPTGTDQSSRTLFGQALSKRSLSLELFQPTDKANSNQAAGGRSDNAVSAPEMPASAPMGLPALDMAPAGRIMMPGWSGEFNHYALQFAEESTFAPANSQHLVAAYQQTVLPLVKEWDAQARLVESNAYVGQQTQESPAFFLPDASGNPSETAVRLMYRLVSSAKKETLVVYLTDTETRVHRLVWGESKLDLSSLNLDSIAAREKAFQAFNNRDADPGYPVYPEQAYPEMEVLYNIPPNASWQIQLNQHSGQNSRYFVSVSFEVPQASQDARAYGSAEIDAISGEIQQLNRPLYYRPPVESGRMPVPSQGEGTESVAVAKATVTPQPLNPQVR